MKTMSILLVAIALLGTANAQTEPPNEFGVLFFFDYNMHSANFTKIPGIPSCCPQYGSGDAFGYSVGIVYEHPLDTDVSLSARLLLADMSARMVVEEHEVMSIDGAPYTGTIEHSIDATLLTVGLEPRAEYMLLPNLTVGAGLNVSYFVTRNYASKEEITDPAHGVFLENMSRTRNEKSGELENTAEVLFGAVTAIRMRFPLGDGGFALYPEVSYLYTFTNIVNGVDWKPHALRAGIAIQKQF